MKKKFLAGLTHAQFLRRHWQKKPLLARQALPEYTGAITREDLIGLAERDDVESRIVTKSGRGGWRVRHGPFARRDIARLPRSGWTLLVQGVDQALEQAARLLREFSFIPHARVDDLMVSYAAPGGGVGPHFDSYDVFLLQGAGTRQWQVSRQRNLDLVDDAPLKILKRFRPAHEWRLEPGDLLYLPPQWAHDGVAIGECITYSIGFRAPRAQELGAGFLEFLQDKLELEGMYADPDLKATRTPGRVPQSMIACAASMLESLRWSKPDVVQFIGCYLTEPKARVVFARPVRPVTPSEFARRARSQGVRLALATRMLHYESHVFVNGEAQRPQARAAHLFAALADQRRLAPPLQLHAAALRLLYDWYCAGYISLAADPRVTPGRRSSSRRTHSSQT